MTMNKRTTILLLTPPYPVEERLGKLGILGGRLPSISLLYLATALREIDCTVHIIDASCDESSLEDILEQAGQLQPDIIGISAVTPAISRAQKLAAALRNAYPRTLIAMGGPHITTVPEETLAQTTAVDIGVVGEGERTLQQIVQTYDGTLANLTGIPGTVQRNHHGTPVLAAPRELIHEIDELGLPAYDLVRTDIPIRPALFKTRRIPAIHAITSRGCTHTCTYCNTNLFNKRVRFHSAGYVIKLIKHLIGLGYKEIAFEDDNFTAHKKRLREVCNYLIEQDIGLSWSVNARIDTVDEEMLRLMKKAGCWYISYGIESGSQETLELVNKKITLDEIRRKVELTRQIGIEAKGFFIIGFPWETPQSLQQTEQFALSLPLSDLNIFPLTPFPGTALYLQAKQQGWFDDDWHKMDLQQIVYVPDGLSKELLLSAIRRLLLRFYLRPATVFNYLRRLLSAWHVIRYAFK